VCQWSRFIMSVTGASICLVARTLPSKLRRGAARYRLSRGDVLVTMSGEIGSVGVVRTDDHLVLNQRVGRVSVRPGTSAELRYLAYVLQHPELKTIMEMTAYGAAQPNISPSLLSSLPILLPSVQVQRNVSRILGVMDALIENNRRRVEVLEEMARVIYREWFVHFRYPGHENAALVDSSLGPIPDDWEVKPLREIADLSGGSALTKASYVDSGYVAFSAAGPDGCLPDFEIEGDGVVLSAVGARCGRTFKATGRWSSIANTIKIVPRSGVCGPSWLYLATRDPSAWPKRGSAQPFISINDARAVQITAPDPATATRFEGACGSLDRAAERLRSEMAVLVQIRDLILPRLVTGQIDVSSPDLDELAEGSVA